MKKISFLVLLITHVVNNFAFNNVSITGLDTAYAGKEIIFSRYLEQITNTETELARCIVDKDGSFSMSFPLEDISFIFSNLGVYRFVSLLNLVNHIILFFLLNRKKNQAIF
jgi:hypothetical protein